MNLFFAFGLLIYKVVAVVVVVVVTLTIYKVNTLQFTCSHANEKA
jgi:hypothetical protein